MGTSLPRSPSSEGAQEGLLVLDEALDAASGYDDEALVDRDMSARGVEVALIGRAPSRKIVEKADYITEMRCEKHPTLRGYVQGKEWSTRWTPRRWRPATSKAQLRDHHRRARRPHVPAARRARREVRHPHHC